TLKSEVEMLAKRQTGPAIESLKRRGNVHEISNRQERTYVIARNYVANPHGTLIISPENKSRHELNAAVRQELRAKGLVGIDDHKCRVLVPRQDMTGAERTWAKRYEVGDVVRFSRGSKGLGITSGSYGSVVAVNAAQNLLTVRARSGNQITYDPKRLS